MGVLSLLLRSQSLEVENRMLAAQLAAAEKDFASRLADEQQRGEAREAEVRELRGQTAKLFATVDEIVQMLLATNVEEQAKHQKQVGEKYKELMEAVAEGKTSVIGEMRQRRMAAAQSAASRPGSDD